MGLPKVVKRGIGTGTVHAGSVGVGLKYISPDGSSGVGGTYGGPGGTRRATRDSHKNNSMQLHRNDFADLKYFEREQPKALPGGRSGTHNNTFDYSKPNRAPRGCQDSQ